MKSFRIENTHRGTGTTSRGFLIQHHSLPFNPNRRMPLRLLRCLQHLLLMLPILGFLHMSTLLAFLLINSSKLLRYQSILEFCHIPYLTSSTSSPTPTFRTYLRPLLRRYSTLVLLTPFRCYATIIIVSLHSTSPIVPCPLLSPIVSIPCYFRLAFLLAFLLATSAHYYHYYLSLSYML